MDGLQEDKSSGKMDALEERISPDRNRNGAPAKPEERKPPDRNACGEGDEQKEYCNDEVADEDPANGDEAERVDNDGHVHGPIQPVTVEENEKIPLAALVPEEDKPPDRKPPDPCHDDNELKAKEKEVAKLTYTYDSFYLDVNSLGEDGLASYFKEVQIDDVIEQYFAMESSNGKGKKKNGQFQDAEYVGKLISRKKPPDRKSDPCGVWDVGTRKTSPLVAGD